MTETELLGDDTTLSTPYDLGIRPYLCVGDITECPDGFTLSWWFEPPEPDTSKQNYYILSSGGQNAASDGIYMRRKYGMEFDVGTAMDDMEWKVSVSLRDDQLVSLTLITLHGLQHVTF